MKAKLLGVLGVIGASFGVVASNVLAAADQTVLDAASTTATTIKENVSGAITANIDVILITGVLILTIVVIWKFAKRFVSGR